MWFNQNEDGIIMGMSTYVKGLRDLDGKFTKMLEVKIACEVAEIDYPQDLKDYFGSAVGESCNYLTENAREIDIEEAVSEWSDGEMREGISLDTTKLPKGVTKILFINAY